MYICTLRGLSYPLPQKNKFGAAHATQLLHDIGAHAFI